MQSAMFVLAYFSPETMLPATSILATAIGIFMMFGKGIFRIVVGSCRQILARPGSKGALKGPHFSMQTETEAAQMSLTSTETTQQVGELRK